MNKTKTMDNTKLSHLRFLDLSKLKLKEISIGTIKLHALFTLQTRDLLYPLSDVSEIDLSEVEFLNLDDNELTNIPSDLFKEFRSLKTLSLRRNKLSVLPNRIFLDLPELEKLHLDDNRLESLPNGIFKNLLNLRVLSLASNRLNSLPWDVFYSLENLRRLYLNRNLLEILPQKIFHKLENLTFLFLERNHLLKLDENLFDFLFRLQRLNLIDNNISFLPDGIFKSQINLRVLFLDIDKIEDLPGSLGACDNLEILSQKFDENDYSFIKDSLRVKFPEYITGDHYAFIQKKEEISYYKRKIRVFEGDIFCIHCGFENIPGDKFCSKCHQNLFYS